LVLAVVMMSNSPSSIDIVEQQSGWVSNIWRQPIGFIIFGLAGFSIGKKKVTEQRMG